METPMNVFEEGLIQLQKTLTDFYNRYKDDILSSREFDGAFAPLQDSIYNYLYKRGKIKMGNEEELLPCPFCGGETKL